MVSHNHRPDFFRLWLEAFSISILILYVLLNSEFAYAEKGKTLKIALDADRTRHSASALSIEKGIRVAFAEVDNKIKGYDIEFVPMDHRGNASRSKVNFKQAFADPDTLLVLAGMHSPPLIKNRRFINENKMLTLVPWAAGGPITRYPSEDNWVFRLSIDDTVAGEKLANHAIKTRGCNTPHLLLEQTPWGESNRKSMSKAIKSMLNFDAALTWFNWGVSEANLRIKLREIAKKKTDCILFVGNANEAQQLARALLSVPKDIRQPIISHWGITGGNFQETITHTMRKEVDIEFIQTCFSFVSSPKLDFSTTVFSKVKRMFDDIETEKDLIAPAGFIHAYDLGKILISALNEIDITNNMPKNRELLKLALENLEKPVRGLLKVYEKPFSTYSNSNRSAHEALNVNDFCMARFGSNNEIILIEKSKQTKPDQTL